MVTVIHRSNSAALLSLPLKHIQREQRTDGALDPSPLPDFNCSLQLGVPDALLWRRDLIFDGQVEVPLLRRVPDVLILSALAWNSGMSEGAAIVKVLKMRGRTPPGVTAGQPLQPVTVAPGEERSHGKSRAKLTGRESADERGQGQRKSAVLLHWGD